MDIKFKELKDILNSVNTLAQKELPIKTAFKLAKLKKDLSLQGEFYDEKYRSIIKKYARTDENGQYVTSDNGQTVEIVPEKIDALNRELSELNNLDLGLTNPPTFKIEDFEGVNISSDDLLGLIGFMEE